MPTAGADWRCRLIVTGFFSISDASTAIGGGIVALKNSVCRRVGMWRRIAADVREKAHVEHAVGFVEHQHFERRELGIRRAEVIEQPAGRGDDDVHAAAKGMLLRPHADAAIDRGAGQRRVDRQRVEILGDLRRQLARRREDERARGPARLVNQAMQDRQQKRGRLPAAGLRARQQVACRSSAGGIASA